MKTAEERAPVSEALYHAKGSPPLDKPATFDDVHLCGSCRRRVLAAPAKKVLTSQFGSWDAVVQDPEGGRWLCLPCASIYRDPLYRRRTHMAVADGTVKQLDLEGVRTVLRGPIPSDVSLIVPLSGKRIIAPQASWGTLTTDTGTIRWSPAHKKVMEIGIELRAMGFPEVALKEGSPPYKNLISIPIEDHEKIRQMWREFSFARDNKVLLPLILFLSRKPAK